MIRVDTTQKEHTVHYILNDFQEDVEYTIPTALGDMLTTAQKKAKEKKRNVVTIFDLFKVAQNRSWKEPSEQKLSLDKMIGLEANRETIPIKVWVKLKAILKKIPDGSYDDLEEVNELAEQAKIIHDFYSYNRDNFFTLPDTNPFNLEPLVMGLTTTDKTAFARSQSPIAIDLRGFSDTDLLGCSDADLLEFYLSPDLSALNPPPVKGEPEFCLEIQKTILQLLQDEQIFSSEEITPNEQIKRLVRKFFGSLPVKIKEKLEGEDISPQDIRLFEAKIISLTPNSLVQEQKKPIQQSTTTKTTKPTSSAAVSGRDVIADHLQESANFNPLSICNNLRKDSSLHDVFGRDSEIAELVRLMQSCQIKSAILLGEPGTGKTSLVNALQYRILRGDYKGTALHDVTIYSLSMAALTGGTGLRGDFEGRFQKVIEYFEKHPNLYLFIDEGHLIVGAGRVKGSQMDASNILKPALASGKIRLILATTNREYEESIENDEALDRRLKPVVIKEPSLEDTVRILTRAAGTLESHYSIKIDPRALPEAVTLADLYLPNDKRRPAKPLNALDDSCSLLTSLQDTIFRLSKQLLLRHLKLFGFQLSAIGANNKEKEAEYRKANKNINIAKQQLQDSLEFLRQHVINKNQKSEIESHLAILGIVIMTALLSGVKKRERYEQVAQLQAEIDKQLKEWQEAQERHESQEKELLEELKKDLEIWTTSGMSYPYIQIKATSRFDVTIAFPSQFLRRQIRSFSNSNIQKIPQALKTLLMSQERAEEKLSLALTQIDVEDTVESQLEKILQNIGMGDSVDDLIQSTYLHTATWLEREEKVDTVATEIQQLMDKYLPSSPETSCLKIVQDSYRSLLRKLSEQILGRIAAYGTTKSPLNEQFVNSLKKYHVTLCLDDLQTGFPFLQDNSTNQKNVEDPLTLIRDHIDILRLLHGNLQATEKLLNEMKLNSGSIANRFATLFPIETMEKIAEILEDKSRIAFSIQTNVFNILNHLIDWKYDSASIDMLNSLKSLSVTIENFWEEKKSSEKELSHAFNLQRHAIGAKKDYPILTQKYYAVTLKKLKKALKSFKHELNEETISLVSLKANWKATVQSSALPRERLYWYPTDRPSVLLEDLMSLQEQLLKAKKALQAYESYSTVRLEIGKNLSILRALPNEHLNNKPVVPQGRTDAKENLTQLVKKLEIICIELAPSNKKKEISGAKENIIGKINQLPIEINSKTDDKVLQKVGALLNKLEDDLKTGLKSHLEVKSRWALYRLTLRLKSELKLRISDLDLRTVLKEDLNIFVKSLTKLIKENSTTSPRLKNRAIGFLKTFFEGVWHELRLQKNFRLLQKDILRCGQFLQTQIRDKDSETRLFLGFIPALISHLNLQLVRDFIPTLDLSTLHKEHVTLQIALQTGIPLGHILEGKRDGVQKLHASLPEIVRGQPLAIRLALNAIDLAAAEFTTPPAPLLKLLAVGPSGTGKTLLAKTIHKYAWTQDMQIVDLGSVTTPESLYHLLGYPHGGKSGVLVEGVRRKPNLLLLLDELEKADPRVRDLLLSLLDEGRLVGLDGKVADYSHALVVMTSNYGVETIAERYQELNLNIKRLCQKGERTMKELLVSSRGEMDRITIEQFSKFPEKYQGQINNSFLSYCLIGLEKSLDDLRKFYEYLFAMRKANHSSPHRESFIELNRQIKSSLPFIIDSKSENSLVSVEVESKSEAISSPKELVELLRTSSKDLEKQKEAFAIMRQVVHHSFDKIETATSPQELDKLLELVKMQIENIHTTILLYFKDSSLQFASDKQTSPIFYKSEDLREITKKNTTVTWLDTNPTHFLSFLDYNPFERQRSRLFALLQDPLVHIHTLSDDEIVELMNFVEILLNFHKVISIKENRPNPDEEIKHLKSSVLKFLRSLQTAEMTNEDNLLITQIMTGQAGSKNEISSAVTTFTKGATGTLTAPFRSEFIGRCEIGLFLPLSRTSLLEIAELELQKLEQLRGADGLVIRWHSDLVHFLVDHVKLQGAFGARPLLNAIKHRVATPLSQATILNTLPRSAQLLLYKPYQSETVQFIDFHEINKAENNLSGKDPRYSWAIFPHAWNILTQDFEKREEIEIFLYQHLLNFLTNRSDIFPERFFSPANSGDIKPLEVSVLLLNRSDTPLFYSKKHLNWVEWSFHRLSLEFGMTISHERDCVYYLLKEALQEKNATELTFDAKLRLLVKKVLIQKVEKMSSHTHDDASVLAMEKMIREINEAKNLKECRETINSNQKYFTPPDWLTKQEICITLGEVHCH